MSLISDSLPVLDAGRALLDEVGLRTFSVTVRYLDWSGTSVGEGARTVTTLPLTVAGGARPKVKQLSADQVVNAGLELGSAVYDVTLTPAYAGGGVTPADIAPPVPVGVKREVHYILVGPGYEAGTLCKLLSLDTGSPFRYVMRLQATGAKP